MTRRPGMTLVELLVAVALVVAIGALVMPSLLGLVGQERLGAATDRVHSAMILARARAQRESVPVRLVARRGDSGLTELFAVPMGEAAGRDGPEEAASPVLEGSTEGTEAAPEAMTGRALCVLPDGVRVEEHVPLDAGTGNGLGAPDSEDARTGDRSLASASGSSGQGSPNQQNAAALTLAVFLPDGTAAGSARFLVDLRGRAVQVTVSRWTGLAHFEAIVAPTESHAQEEAPPQEPADEATDEPAEDGGRP